MKQIWTKSDNCQLLLLLHKNVLNLFQNLINISSSGYLSGNSRICRYGKEVYCNVFKSAKALLILYDRTNSSNLVRLIKNDSDK